ncbi:MAG TPA: hypothetical protein V6D12_13830 [Candidatus Obscuribacterales bacterium]
MERARLTALPIVCYYVRCITHNSVKTPPRQRGGVGGGVLLLSAIARS